MSEEIKKNEMNEDALEAVSGGINEDEVYSSGFEGVDAPDRQGKSKEHLMSGSMLR